MIVLLFMLFLFFFFLMLWYFTYLSKKIDSLRLGEEPGQFEDAFFFLLGSSGKSWHMAPFPFFSEYNDDEEIIATIRKRNIAVGIFWLVSIVFFIFIPKNN